MKFDARLYQKYSCHNLYIVVCPWHSCCSKALFSGLSLSSVYGARCNIFKAITLTGQEQPLDSIGLFITLSVWSLSFGRYVFFPGL